MLESSHPCWLWVEICGQGPSSCGKVYLATFSCKPPVTFFFRWHPVDHTPGPRQRWIFFRCQCLSQRTAMEGERWVNRTEAWFRLWVLTWSRKTSRSSWKRHRAWRELIKRVKSTIDPKSMETKTFFFDPRKTLFRFAKHFLYLRRCGNFFMASRSFRMNRHVVLIDNNDSSSKVRAEPLFAAVLKDVLKIAGGCDHHQSHRKWLEIILFVSPWHCNMSKIRIVDKDLHGVGLDLR